MDIISRGEGLWIDLVTMLHHPFFKIFCYSNMQNSVVRIGENVNEAACDLHGSLFTRTIREIASPRFSREGRDQRDSQ